MPDSPPHGQGLCIRLLGEIEVERDGAPLALPQSKKTRALLAYLAVVGRPQRRERLCAMLWEIPDDPRGALRWSLSKLRTLIDGPDNVRIVADRDTVSFDVRGVAVDLFAVRREIADGIDRVPTERLCALAEEFRGEFLEGLDLPSCPDFQAWCTAEREEARLARMRLLDTIVARLDDEPERALPYARTLVRIDAANEAFRARLVGLLGRAGRREQAERQFEVGQRLLAEMGVAPSGVLAEAWRALGSRPAPPQSAPSPAVPPTAKGVASQAQAHDGAPPLIGRDEELQRLTSELDRATALRRGRVVLLTGEPGVGKSRLLAELIKTARGRGATVLEGCVYEAEAGEPYGPWVDALDQLATAAVGGVTGQELAVLMPALGEVRGAAGSRERLFGAVVDLIAARVNSGLVVIVLDDVHWCDAASAALLHYVVRMNRFRPVLVALAAREGELPDNPSMESVLRSLRRERLIEELVLAPLRAEETAELLRLLFPGVDAVAITAESRGNPLFAIELARATPHRRDGLPPSLGELIRDRITRLPVTAVLTLRWASVLGRAFSVRRLEKLLDLDPAELVSALEILERHALIRAGEGGREAGDACAFVHDLVRRAVYADLSGPRRRLMHRRVAEILVALAENDPAASSEIVDHAALAGDMATAAAACVAAGRRCLRVFANTEAYSLARRGQHYAEALGDPDRLRLALELMQIELGARRPERPEEVARRLEALSEQAMDYGCLEHARLGFHMLGYLRWEGGEWSGAQRDMLRAEMVARSADDGERAVAMAEAARCLVLLERDLGQAESLLLEADALSRRTGVAPDAIPATGGMLRLHQGAFEEGAPLLREARELARRNGDRRGEFQALEQLVILELQRGRTAEAARLADELTLLGDRFREGSEAPFAHALAALSHDTASAGEDDSAENIAPANVDGQHSLDQAIDALREVDSKHRLAFVLTRAALADLRRGEAMRAHRRAAEALDHAHALERPSEVVLARVALMRAASMIGEEDAARRGAAALAREISGTVSAEARHAASRVLAEYGFVAHTDPGRIPGHGTRRRRKTVRPEDHL